MVKNKSSYKKWTTKADNELVAWRHQGRTWNYIAKRLGTSEKAVAARASQLRSKGVDIPKSKVGRKPKTQVNQHVKSEPQPTVVAQVMTPVDELTNVAIKLKTYIALLEAKNASLQHRLNEIEKVLRD